MAHIDPLQDATETLRIERQGLPSSLVRQLRGEAPKLLEAIQAVVEAGGTSHIAPPELTSDERAPETVPNSGIFDSIFDGHAPRHLKDVWDGQGDVGDPLVPQDDHEHELVLARLREASDKGVDASLPSE
jgi:hypothetical protein